MAVIKQACPKCGQRVSGDESFYGTSVECPICTSKIFFPDPDKKEDSDDRKSSDSDSSDKSAAPDRDAADEKNNKDQKEPSSSSSKSRSLDELAEPKRKTRTKDDSDSAPPKVSTSRTPSPPAREATYSEAPSPTLSIISMVLGILNAVTFCLPSVMLAPAAIICGHIALIKGKFSPIQPAPGRSMAITGLILGYLGMLVMFVFLGLAVSGIFNIFEWTRGHFGSGQAD